MAARENYKAGRISNRPAQQAGNADYETGLQPLHVDNNKAGLLYIPTGYMPDQPAALAVMLHGSGGAAEQGISLLRRYADTHTILLIAPAARHYSWDIIAARAFGPDVQVIDQALAYAFSHFAINPKQVAVGGFSDGASYALSLGLTNGDVFTHIIAFSPGFAFTHQNNGKPAVFISHGVHDAVLPIDACGRRVVLQLQQQQLEVNYLEFEGGHEIPASISERAVAWFVGDEQRKSY